MGRRGVVWDREGEEGMMGYTEERDGKRGKGKEGRKEERDDLAPQTKFLDPPLIVSAQPAVPVYLTNVVILKMLSTS
jgi:hypothetical protein